MVSETIITALIAGVVGALAPTLSYITAEKNRKQKISDEQKKLLEETTKNINQTLQEHREEYLKGIDEVRESITDMKAVYQQTIAVVDLKIDALEKKQDKHNNLIERTYRLESDMEVVKEKQSVANHRIDDLEKKV